MNTEEQLEGLLAREAIRDLVTARYCSTADWLDIEGMKDCFTDDSEVFFGENSMGGHEFCEWWRGFGASFEMRFHNLDCVLIELDGNTARTETRGITAGTVPDPDRGEGALKDFLNCSRYFFDVVKQESGWRIAKLQITVDGSFGQPNPRIPASGGEFDRGLDTSHQIYRHLKGYDR